MTKGKITVESGEYKAIFDITGLEDGQNVTINFEPGLLKKDNENTIFVKNVVSFLIWYLEGENK